jgi:hypothetical protein
MHDPNWNANESRAYNFDLKWDVRSEQPAERSGYWAEVGATMITICIYAALVAALIVLL